MGSCKKKVKSINSTNMAGVFEQLQCSAAVAGEKVEGKKEIKRWPPAQLRIGGGDNKYY